MPIGGSQRVNVVPTQVRDCDKVAAPPGEALSAKLENQEVGGQPREATVTVREGVDKDETVMEAHGDLIRAIDLMVDPIMNVIHELTEVGSNLPVIGADPALGFF